MALRRYKPVSWAALRALAVIIGLSSCSTAPTTSMHQRPILNFGTDATIHVCLLRDLSVPRTRVDLIVAGWNAEFAPFGIRVEIPWVRDWQRPGFMMGSLIGDIGSIELERPCDRIVALVGRHAGDVIWSLLLPQVLGAVELPTRTHGFVVTEDRISRMTPQQVANHEFYHLLGCTHDPSIQRCHRTIADLKSALAPGADFFPGIDKSGDLLRTREDVNRVMRDALHRDVNNEESPPKNGDKRVASN